MMADALTLVWLMWLFWILVAVGLIVAGIVLSIVAVVRMPNSRRSESERNPALQVLNERFARGEIDAPEYRQRRHTLQVEATEAQKSNRRAERNRRKESGSRIRFISRWAS